MSAQHIGPQNAPRLSDLAKGDVIGSRTVALTRAEDILCVGGALSKTASKAGAAPDSSWHARVAAALASLGAVREDHAIWGERLCHRNASFATADAATAHAAPASAPALPAWAPTTSGYYRWGVEAASNALTLAASRPMRDASRWSVTSR